MKDGVAIRRAGAADLPAVYAGELDYIREIEPEQEARWKEAIPLHLRQWTAALDSMFIAESAGQAAGYCFWEVHGGEAVLASIYVRPDRRREGIGRELLARFIGDAKDNSIAVAALAVRPDNPARKLYETMGFVHTRDAGGYCRYRRDLMERPH